MQWESDNDLRALLLSAPPGHGTTEVCSHFVDIAEGKDSQADGPVLYFFCSSAPKVRRLTYLTHTLLHQIVHCSNTGKSNSIAVAFLSTLVDGHFQRRSPDFRENDLQETTVKKVLNAADDELIEALAEALKKAGIGKLSIMVDGLWEGVADWFVQFIMDAAPQLKALLTSRPNSLQNIRDGIMCVEYDKERQECLRSLEYDDTRYEKISEEHHGSLEWLWTHSQYLRWSASATSSLLYIEGKPGSGKSTLAKYFKENLLKREPNASSSTVAHYFYTFRGTVLESTHENMLRSILYSILRQDESAFFHFQLQFRDFKYRNCSKWPYESLKSVLSSFANHPPTKPLYLILDALDESHEDDRRSIIELICNLCSEKNTCSIKVFLASRPVAELTYCIGEHHVIIMQNENEVDICSFARDFLKNLRLTGKTLREATDYITKNAQGVFVWVSLVKAKLLTIVVRGGSEADILECLKELPRELEDFYKYMFDMLEKGDTKDIRDGIRLFRFVLFALRPLTILELRDALAIADDHNPSYERFLQSKPREIDTRIEHCGGNFLEIKLEGIVQFMHQTAREFLIRTIPNASNIQFETSDITHRATTMTIRYLMLCFTTPRMRDVFSKIESWSPGDFQAYAEYLNEWPLLEYTLRYIKDHHDLCDQNEDVSQLVTTLVRQLGQHQASYFFGSFINFRFGHNYGNAFPVNRYQEASENMKYSTLNAAADPKLPHVMEALLLTCTQDAPHVRRKTPLIISVQKGLAGATQLLLNRDDDKDTKDDFGRTALHYAVENGDETIVQLLVQQGADKRIRNNSEETALQIAVKKL
ncbi:hypothetical protein BDD12DRAFT_73587 [Trichophaea hybrida]|nr:hypothetical protein BDD12DRAFT_73587 [Trichophaea hybrida]